MTLARTIASPFNSPLPWEPQGGNRIDDTPIAIFGAANVKLMLDYTLGVTLGTPPAVAAWADQSGNANNASQGTAGNRPDLVADGLDFNGTTDSLAVADAASLDATTRLVIAMAFTPDVVSGTHVPISKAPGSGGSWSVQTNSAAIRLHIGSAGTSFAEGGTMSSGALQRMIWEFVGGGATNPDKIQQYLNSASATSLSFIGTIPASIPVGGDVVTISAFNGGAQFFDGRIRRLALIVPSATSTAAQRARLDAWLARP